MTMLAKNEAAVERVREAHQNAMDMMRKFGFDVGNIVEVAQAGTVTQGVVNFNITIELTDADANIKPGMTAAVTITVKQLDNVLLVPNRAVRQQEGQRFVYILRSGQIEKVDITLGASSDSVSEVVSGNLNEGDTIILNPAIDMMQAGGPPPFIVP